MEYHTTTRPSLKVHEWLAISIVIAMLASITLITKVHGSRMELHLLSQAKKSNDSFDVLVKGAVNHPGIYHLRSAMQMKDILMLAGVKADADLRRYGLDGWVKKGRVIHVPIRHMITVHLEGAVKGKSTLKVPKGSKVCDLLSVIALAEDADVEFLQKKRTLKEGEVIVVPTLK